MGLLCSPQSLAQDEHIGGITTPCLRVPTHWELPGASFPFMGRDQFVHGNSSWWICESVFPLRFVVKEIHLCKLCLYQAVAGFIVRSRVCCCLNKRKGMAMGRATNSICHPTSLPLSLGSPAGGVFSWWMWVILIKTLVGIPGNQPALTF